MFSDPPGQRLLLDGSSKHQDSHISGLSSSLDNNNLNLNSLNTTLKNQLADKTLNIDGPSALAELVS